MAKEPRKAPGPDYLPSHNLPETARIVRIKHTLPRLPPIDLGEQKGGGKDGHGVAGKHGGRDRDPTVARDLWGHSGANGFPLFYDSIHIAVFLCGLGIGSSEPGPTVQSRLITQLPSPTVERGRGGGNSGSGAPSLCLADPTVGPDPKTGNRGGGAG